MVGPVKVEESNERVYIFLDESGNLDFSPSGTRYFVMTSVVMRRPFLMNAALDDYKYECIQYGFDQERFHCAVDNAYVRHRVFELISGSLGGVEIDGLIVEKPKTGPALTDERRFYPEMLGYLLKYVLNRPALSMAEEVIIITDTIPVQRRRQTIEKAIKLTLAKALPSRSKYRILHHDSRSHYGLQVADYCCWALFRKYERGDSAHLERIKGAVRSEFDIFRKGSRYYY